MNTSSFGVAKPFKRPYGTSFLLTDTQGTRVGIAHQFTNNNVVTGYYVTLDNGFTDKIGIDRIAGKPGAEDLGLPTGR